MSRNYVVVVLNSTTFMNILTLYVLCNKNNKLHEISHFVHKHNKNKHWTLI